MDSLNQDRFKGLSFEDLRKSLTSTKSPLQIVQENHSPNPCTPQNLALSLSEIKINDGVADSGYAIRFGQGATDEYSFDFRSMMPEEDTLKRTPLRPSQGNKQPIMSSEEKPVTLSLDSQVKLISSRPQFGKPTALGNASPAHKPTAAEGGARPKIEKSSNSYDHLFAKSRPKAPEFYKPPGASNPLQSIGKLSVASQPTQFRSTASSSQVTTGQSKVNFGESKGLYTGASSAGKHQNNAYIIPKPGGQNVQTFHAPKFPSFSSRANTNPYLQARDDLVDLTKPTEFRSKDDDTFDDRQVFGDNRFGMNDPYMYLDSEKANDNIKALLEGAVDDEEDKPRTRRKKKALSSDVDDLAKKMQNTKVSDNVEAEEDEEEDDGTREGLKVRLLPHQIEGVEWMINKEIGTKKVKGILPKGGILADDMGLGKTIQSITLLLSNPRPTAEELEKSKRKLDPSVDKSTLIVAPLALIKQWEGELRDRVDDAHRMKVHIHHGPQRTKSHKDLRKHDIVITTYHTLSAEHIQGSELQGALFGVNWYRIILDEAHSIKNRNAKVTKAACALTSEYRWCLTGTPMQNNLDELQSLIHFLRIKPYENLEVWRDQITKPMNNGRGGLSIRRLRAFLSAFMKRRTKDVLKQASAKDDSSQSKGNPDKGFHIVKRTIKAVEAEFSTQEWEFYQGLEARTDRSLERMVAGQKLNYASALALIMRLRQACNHPRLLQVELSNEQDPVIQTPSRKTSKASDMDDIANMLGGLTVETKNCDICQAELGDEATKAGLLRCEECEKGLASQESPIRERKVKRSAKLKARAANRRVVLDNDDEDEAESSEDETSYASTDDEDEDGNVKHRNSVKAASNTRPDLVSSAKIRQLIKILQEDVHNHKYIVFSFFTSMLNIIEPFMRHHHIKFARYDGKMRNDQREQSLNDLRYDPTVRVLLCSLRAGSLGLNLTAASRVVILEPDWNPFVEEQAIDRVHRLNQTQDVVVHKLTVKDTIEARILELQGIKRELAKATIEGEKGMGAGKISLQEMLKLFRHNGDEDDMSKLSNVAVDQKKAKKPVRKEDPIYGRRW